jgi:precorrin-6B methylase 2
MKKLGFFLFSKLGLLSFYSLKKSGYLHDKGWFKTFKLKRCVDQNGNPIPWMTYAFVDFLTPRLKKDFKVFEYGCGNSSLWWAKRVDDHTACEHNKDWLREVERNAPDNLKLIHRRTEGGEFAEAILEEAKKFDIIIIDGEDRNSCAESAVKAISENGIIIWDNSDREAYQQGYDHLINNGFKRLDFYGLGPINVMAWSTSVFYRPNNCLDI